MMPAKPDVRPTERLVALHGFTQTHHHCHALAFELGSRSGFASVVVPDLTGHGLSSADRTDLDTSAAKLADRCGHGTYMGYSMGGRIALAAAVARPDLVERLVLIGATAGIDDASARAERRSLDDQRARRVEDIGVDAFLADWLAAPIFSGLPDDPVGLAHRRRNTAAGLAHSLRTWGTGSQTSLWDRVGDIEVPTLVVAGERDAKFTAIGRRLAELIPAATFVAVGDAGHAAHVEQHEMTIALLADWISSTRAS